MSKLNVDHHIEVELTMDELDLTAAESKATYEEIKEYVLEKFGLKVSQLYIAQIKRKCENSNMQQFVLCISKNSNPVPISGLPHGWQNSFSGSYSPS